MIKPRKDVIQIGHKEKFDQVESSGDGRVRVKLLSGEWVTPDSVSTERSYEKESGGDRVLTKSHELAIGDWLREIANSYDEVWVIDTNTKNIDGENISVATSLESYFTITPNLEKVNIRKRIGGHILFKNAPDGQAEKVGWCKLIGIIQRRAGYKEDTRIAIVTDHDRDIHKSLNNRSRPIFEGVNSLLPRNISLVYASDRGRDNILNSFISKCDKESAKIIKYLERDGSFEKDGQLVSITDIPNFDITSYNEN